MTYQHTSLAAGRWRVLAFLEQMAHIGSEVGRALNWRAKGHDGNCERAYIRALELLDLSLDDPRNRMRAKELARVRESLVDFFDGSNEYCSTEEQFRRYFDEFALAASRHR